MVYVSDLVDRSNDFSGLYFRSPFENGYLVNWDVQLSVWDRLFSESLLNVCTSYPSFTKIKTLTSFIFIEIVHSQRREFSIIRTYL
ncbi:Actin-like protein ARP6 [Smittium mucronatum]|uniref:Actin-like protein ARP6 n=1 Tax=Smittium mucronatum TaxID=133383 RepID=A0A1R0H0S4_9FUNG|nr:Actin-like protein ARP6 [Smittium mucronatum]